MKQLERINLNHTKVTTANLAHLGDFSKLRFLHLEGTATTDESLKALAKCRHLTQIELSDFQGTEEALEEFRKSRPGCRVRNSTLERVHGVIY